MLAVAIRPWLEMQRDLDREARQLSHRRLRGDLTDSDLWELLQVIAYSWTDAANEAAALGVA